MVALQDLLEAYPPRSLPNAPLVDAESLNTCNGATGPMTLNLSACFTFEQRKALKNISVSCDADSQELRGEFREQRARLQEKVQELFEEIHWKAASAPEIIRRAVGRQGIDAEEDSEEASCRKNKFFSLVRTRQTRVEYIRRCAQALSFWLALLNESNRSRCGIVLDAATLEALRVFQDSPGSKEDVKRLVLGLLSHDRGVDAFYNREILCLYPIANLVSNTNLFTCSGVSQKAVSSLKYLCRGCVLLDILARRRPLEENLALKHLKCNSVSTFPFNVLDIYHKGINSMKRTILDRVVLIDENSTLVDGVEVGARRISKVLKLCLAKLRSKLERCLLLEYQPEPVSTPSHLDHGELRYGAFGQPSENLDGSHALTNHVLSNPDLKKRFFTMVGKIKKQNAERYLRKCLEFEKEVISVMHLLMGASSRATDYEQLTFRNAGYDRPRRIAIFNEELILVERQSRKRALRNEADQKCPAVLPRKWFEHVIQYWLNVRPFCSLLARTLRRSDTEVDRWQRFCFVKATSKQITTSISRSFDSEGSIFQLLRHGSEAHFREYVVPKELGLSSHFNFDSLLGHKYKTGLSYGVLKLMGSDNRHAGTDISSLTRCLKAWWEHIGLKDLTEDDLKELADQIENDDPDFSSTADVDDESSDDNDDDDNDDSDGGDDDDANVYTSTEIEGNNETVADAYNGARGATDINNDEEKNDDQNQEQSVFPEECNRQSCVNNEEVAERLVVVENFSFLQENAGNETETVEENAMDAINSNKDVSEQRERVSEASLQMPEQSGWTSYDHEESGNVAFDAIRKLGYAQFRSAAQEELVKLVLDCKTSVAGVLPTGAGKTLAIQVALVENSPGITLVIYPLKSVFDDAVARLERLARAAPRFRDTFATYESGLALRLLNGKTKLLLATVEQARNRKFLAQVKENHSRVRRVVFDEAPIFVTSMFRLGLSSVPIMLRSYLSCPFVLLTATLQVSQEETIRKAFSCPGLVIVRGPTVRAEIKHKVVRLNTGKVTAQDVAKYLVLEENALAIVFVQSVEECKTLFLKLDSISETRGRVVNYHGSLNPQERKDSAHSWSSGRKPLMIATTAFAYGIHDDKCRRIIHVEGAFDLETYVQAVGRAGRDGRDAESFILKTQRSSTDDSNFSRFLSADDCRLSVLSSFLDTEGLRWQRSCGRCDWCVARSMEVHEVCPTWLRQKVQVCNPTENVLPSHERCQASATIASIKQRLGKIKKLCLSRFCFTCFVFSEGHEKMNHGLSKCPRWKNRCFRCGSGCKRSECPNQHLITKKLSKSSLCVTCSLPAFCYDVDIHSGDFSMGKRCRYRDSLLPAMLLMWQEGRTKALIQSSVQTRLHTLEDFLSWALEAPHGLNNFVSFLFKYLRR